MKKYLIVIICLIVSVCMFLCACGGETNNDAAEDTEYELPSGSDTDGDGQDGGIWSPVVPV